MGTNLKKIIAALFLLASPNAVASTFDLPLTGRLTEKNGKPIEGPVELSISFFHVPKDGVPVATVTDGLASVSLQEGIFQVTLNLSASDWQRIFPDTAQPVYVEVTDVTHAVDAPYSRFQVAMAPLAGKVPVDGKTIAFDDEGRARLVTAGASAAGKLLSADGAGGLVWVDPPSNTVTQVSGVSAANVALGANAANAASSAKSAGAIVKRDATGGFEVGAVSADSVTLAAATATSSPLTVKAAATQTADLQQWLSSTGSLLAGIGADGSLKLGTANNTVSLKAPAGMSGNISYILPAVPANGKFLTTDANGVLSWVSLTGGGDMARAVFDANNDGIVDASADGQKFVTGSGWAGAAPAVLTTLGADLAAGATTATVASTAGYPSAGLLVIGNEVIRYSGLTGTTFTGLTRGVFGTTDALQTTGAAVNNLLFSAAASASTPKVVVTGEGRTGIGTIKPGAMLETTSTTDLVTQIVRGSAGQTAALQQWQANNGTILSYVDKDGGLALKGSDTANYVTLKAGAGMAGNLSLTLPPAQGASGSFLTNNGSGILSWSTATAPASGTIATIAGAETLTNKTFDGTTTITGATAASLTNGSATITLPTATGTLATLAGTETLTNKTISGGSLAANAGTAAAPSVSFAGDTDTGMWSSGANTVNVSTGGSERLRVDASGNVGIGTTTPAKKLDVVGDAIRLTGTADWTELFVGSPGAHAALTLGSNVGGTNPMYYQLFAGGGATAATSVLDFWTNFNGGGASFWGFYGDGKTSFHCSGGSPTGTSLTAKTTMSDCFDRTILAIKNSNLTTGNMTEWRNSADAVLTVIDKAGHLGIGTTAASQALDVNGSIALPATTSSSTGVLYKGSTPFIHDFAAAGSDGKNTFVGLNAGNFTLSQGANPSYYASYNTAVGATALAANTSGFVNSAFGFGALTSNTSGSVNGAFGHNSLSSNTTGTNNNAFGYFSLKSNTTGIYNSAFGDSALASNTTASRNTSFGHAALAQTTSGSGNTAVGDSAAYFASSPLQTISDSTFIGSGATATTDGVVNSTAIGNGAQVTQSNQVVIGNGSVTQTLLNGNVGIGTTTPGYALDVSGTVRATNFLSSTGTSTWGSSNLTNIGSIGIGSTATSSAVNLGGDSARAVTVDRHTTANTAGNNLTIASGGAASGATDKAGGNLVLSSGIATGTASSDIEFKTATAQGSSSTTDNAPTTKMAILGNGNVGIGTTSPSTLLQVSGATRPAISVTGMTSDVVRMQQITTGDAVFSQNVSYNGSAYNLDNTSQPGWSISMNNASDPSYNGMYFTHFTAGANPRTGTNAMYIAPSGMVGIGTTAPSYRLSLDGGGASGSVVSRFRDTGNNLHMDIIPYNGVIQVGASSQYFTTMALESGGALSVYDASGGGFPGIKSFGVTSTGLRINNIESGTVNGVAYSPLTLRSNYFGISTATPAIDVQVFKTDGSLNSLSRLQVYNGDDGKIVLLPNGQGNVGIGTSNPGYKLEVAGTIAGDAAYVNTSDIRLKKDIETLPDALAKLDGLRGVTFSWKDSEKFDDRRHLGVVAQEVEAVYPEAVVTGQDGIKRVAYSDLVPVLIEAVKDLKAENTLIKSSLRNLKAENALLKVYLCDKDPAAEFCAP